MKRLKELLVGPVALLAVGLVALLGIAFLAFLASLVIDVSEAVPDRAQFIILE